MSAEGIGLPVGGVVHSLKSPEGSVGSPAGETLTLSGEVPIPTASQQALAPLRAAGNRPRRSGGEVGVSRVTPGWTAGKTFEFRLVGRTGTRV